MELLFEDGSNLPLSPNSSPTELGRRSLPNSDDRTISRRHILLRPHGAGADVDVDFEVVGRNPIWVALAGDRHGGRIFRKFEKGKLASGDRFSLSVRNPCFVLVCGVEVGERRKMETLEREAAKIGEVGAVQVPGIDPVKEFGFLVIGHEFDNYPKSKIHDVRNWDWFLDGSKQYSEDEEVTVEERPSTREKVMKRKGKKKDRDSDDEDWTGESEGEEEKIAGLRSSKRPRAAATRSKDEASADELRKQKLDALGRNEEEDDDDETLGGFIVDNASVEEEEESGLSNDEKEFTDEDEDDDE